MNFKRFPWGGSRRIDSEAAFGEAAVPGPVPRPARFHSPSAMSLTSFVLENAIELREAIVRRNVRDVVAGKIAALIASGILKLGDDLPSERDLAAGWCQTIANSSRLASYTTGRVL